MQLKTTSLSFQVLAAISLLVFTAMVLMGLIVSYLASHYLQEERIRLGQSTARMIQRALSNPTKAQSAAEKEGFRVLAHSVAEEYFDPVRMHSITFFDLSYSVLWSSLPEERWLYAKSFGRNLPFPVFNMESNVTDDAANGETVVVHRFPWKIGKANIGVVQLVEPLISTAEKSLFSLSFILVLALGYAAVVVLFGIAILRQLVTRPLAQLNEAVHRLIQGERGLELPIEHTNEIGKLAQSFNVASKQLATNEAHLAAQIKELKQMNEELEITKRSLIRSEKMAGIGRLAAGVAHEVGNPLSAILGYVELLKAGGIDEETSGDFLSRIEKDITRIHMIITGLLDYSRPRKERIELVDLNTVILETINLVSMQKQFKEIEFTFNSTSDTAFVMADKHRLEQVFVNLFLNAQHAMEGKGAISCFLERVQFDPAFTYREAAERFRRNQALIAVSVSDEGEGISKEAIERIFDPFFTTKDIGQGTGLGLSVCDKIIDDFGGMIDVTSQAGEGATFTILMPKAPDAKPKEDEKEQDETTSESHDESNEPTLIG